MKKLLILSVIFVSSCGILPEKPQKLEDDKELMAKIDSIETPSIAGSLYQSAQDAMAAGNYKKASEYYSRLVKDYPDNEQYKFSYVEAARKVGECKAVMPVYEQLIAKNPNNLDYLEGKGLCLLSNAQFPEAGELFTKIINADSTRWRSINGAGIIFATKKKYAEANQYFDLAADVSGNNPSVLGNQGLAKAMIGNYPESIKVLREASALSGDKTDQKRRVDLNLALVLGISGDLDGAKQVSEKHLTEAQLYNNLGVYADLAKKPELARTYLDKALTETKVYYDRAWNNLERVEKKN